MLNTILGSALGGLAAGAVALIATASVRGAAEPPLPTPMVEALGSPGASGGPALVECEPHQRAELRRVAVNGRELAQIACVSVVSPYAQSDIVAVPSTDPRAMTARPAVVQERVVVREEPVRRASAQRSWTKSALVIGGGAGAGAGVGGLVGGKKGALIGAAIGGGSAAIFEAAKRK
jgi:hypothetical protein